MGKASRTKQERREATDTAPPEEAPVPDYLGPDVALAKRRKESAVTEKEERGTDDLVPWLAFFRDGRLVANVLCNKIDRDQALDAAFIAVGGYDADELRLCLDAHVSTERGPRPGEEWQPGQMQRLCDEEGACDLGLITDTLWLLRMLRDGTAEWVNLPYHVHKSAKTVRWAEEGAGFHASDGKLTGLVPDALRAAFARKRLSEALEESGVDIAELFGVDPERARIHEDCAVTRLLMETGKYSVMLPAYNDEDAEVIAESLQRHADVEKIDIA